MRNGTEWRTGFVAFRALPPTQRMEDQMAGRKPRPPKPIMVKTMKFMAKQGLCPGFDREKSQSKAEEEKATAKSKF